MYAKSLSLENKYSYVEELKGTWQRGGFSGVFAEIGTA
jgi:hypothetical protein